ncbi:MAG: MIP/aquaporin family protein [Thermoflexales bacterium]
MTRKDIQAILAEFIGTFAFVFIGSAAVWATVQPGYGGGPLVPAFAHGLVVMFVAFSLGNVSGAFVNPAVTLSAALAGALPWLRAVLLIVAQVVAGVAAAFLLRLFLPQGAAANFGAFAYNPAATNAINAMFVELILTFFLAFVALEAAVKGKAGSLAPIGVGLTLTTLILAGGAITGASLNPARSIGPALAAGQLDQLWIYVLGPVLGAVLAAVVSTTVFAETKEPTPPKKPTGRR